MKIAQGKAAALGGRAKFTSAISFRFGAPDRAKPEGKKEEIILGP
jgi:hypothetical protein